MNKMNVCVLQERLLRADPKGGGESTPQKVTPYGREIASLSSKLQPHAPKTGK